MSPPFRRECGAVNVPRSPRAAQCRSLVGMRREMGYSRSPPHREASMKGVVFTEFLEMVGAKFGEDMVDDVILACELPSGGAYTSVGTYDHQELFALVG